ncbi:hypothetical protein CTI12_AA006250 [Artemisia annua]|uniref:COI1 F-box domain-containing protein n=1 Tax=Artemisia annua TaxID=35608 RepID=A0A2U1QNH7_ARTAN|nr:hypothetical protein CTI12_AA006250 [Artemisia annua]
MDKHPHESIDTVFDCVIPYIHNGDDRNVVSLVCRRWYELDCMARKHLTVHVFYSLEPSHVAQRFPYLESLTLKGFPREFQNLQYIDLKPWIKEIVSSFKCLKALDIRRVLVHDSDLELLARSRGKDLRVLKINNCKYRGKINNCKYRGNGFMHIGRHCNNLRTLCLEDDTKNLKIWKSLHELALNNTHIESVKFSSPISEYGVKVLKLLAKSCSQSLVSLKMGECYLSHLRGVFKHAVNLKDFACCELQKVGQEGEYVGFSFPPNMRCICINSIDKIGLPFVLSLSNQLRELNLKHLNEDNQCSLIRNCPNLEALYINDMFGDNVLQVIGQSCKKLRKLKTDGLAVTHMGLTDLAQGCLELECLHINSSKHISNESFVCIGSHLKNLVDFHITLHYSASVLGSGIGAMLIGCSKLKRLRINPCGGQLTNVSLSYIGKYGHNLRYLSLGYTREFEAGLVELSKGCPKLRKLEIKNCASSKQALSLL